MEHLNNGQELTLKVFDFTDYRELLKAYVNLMKSKRTFFSYRYFSRLAGLGGKNYLQMVMTGRRNLSPDSIAKFARALRLSKKEAAYFEALVLYNQASDEAGRDHYFAQMVKLRPTTPIEGISKDQFEYLTQSLYVIIREMAALPGFQADAAWIQQNIRRVVKPAEIRQALSVLERLGLLTRLEQDRLSHSGKTLETPENIESLEILNYHRQILNETKEALINIHYAERDISSMTIPMPQPLIPEVKAILRKCREDIAHLINQGSRNFYEVFQINMQFFPVTELHKTKTP